MDQKTTDKHKENTNSNSSKLRAFIAGLTPATIFKLTLASSVVIALAATIIWHTASDTLRVNISPVNTETVVLDGSRDLGGIELGGYKAVEWSVSNQSTKPAYVFVRIEEATPGLYEVVDNEGWSRVTASDDSELVYAYTGGSGAEGGAGSMQPVNVGDNVLFRARLHCLASAEEYSYLSGDDMDIEVTGCLIYGVGENE